MKKLFLVLAMAVPTLLAAQNGIVISNFAVSAAGSVTLDISWKAEGMPPVWLDSAWVFVDYNEGGAMKRLSLNSGATLLNPSAQGDGYGIVIEEAGNNQGVWVVGKTRGLQSSFSATVVLPFNPATDVKGACAYASNYPPLGALNEVTVLAITGTPPYTIHLQGASPMAPFETTNNPFILPAGYTLQKFTDKTGAPGKLQSLPPTAPTQLTASAVSVCSGTAVTLTVEGGDNGSGARFEWGTGNVASSGSFAVTPTGSPTVTTPPIMSSTTFWVRRVSTDGYGATAAATCSVNLTASPAFTQNNPEAASICNNTAHTFNLAEPTGGSGELTYLWEQSSDNSNWTTASGANNAQNYTTPQLTTNTYYRRNAAAATCGGTITTSGALVTVTPTNTYTLASGSTNTSATLSVSITPIVYNTTGATGVSANGLPSGVTASFGSNQVTISGTPSATGTFNYSATLTGGCGVVAATGIITVAATTVTTPDGSGTQTWTCGTQTWSGPLKKTISGISATTDLGTTNPPANCKYRSSGIYSGSGFLYNWICVRDNAANKLCESPWRVPTNADFVELRRCTIAKLNDGVTTEDIWSKLVSDWNCVLGGYTYSTVLDQKGVKSYYWSSDRYSETQAYIFAAYPTTVGANYTFDIENGIQVRCVR